MLYNDVNKDELINIDDLVININNKLEKFNTSGEYYLKLTFESNGYEVNFKYLGFIIFSDANDEREFIKSKNQYESLEKYLIKQINKINKYLKHIKI